MAALEFRLTEDEVSRREKHDPQDSNSEWSEINRLMLALAFTGSTAFRRRIIERGREPFDAPPIEIGLEMPRLLNACLLAERRATIFRFVYLVPVLIALNGLGPFLAWGEFGTLFLALVIAAAIGIVDRMSMLYGYAQNFSRAKFTSSTNVSRRQSLTTEDTCGLGPPQQNVALYKGFSPFEFAGTALSGWSVAVDVSRPGSVGGGEAPLPFDLEHIRATLRDGLRSIRMNGIDVRDILAVSGEDASILPDKSYRHGITVPALCLTNTDIDRVSKQHPDKARRYWWVLLHGWEGDLVASAFIRCSMQESFLYVEHTRCFLAPITDKNRLVDKIAFRYWRSAVKQVASGAIMGPFAALSSVWWLFVQANSVVSRMTGSRLRAKIREIRENPDYNYGATKSERAVAAGGVYRHYFQKMDHDYFFKLIDRRLLDTLVAFLDEHNIDTSELKENRTVISNAGVIVQGGNLTTQTLAVGEGARASTHGLKFGFGSKNDKASG